MDFSKMDKNKCPKMDFGFSIGGKKERNFGSLSRFLNNIYPRVLIIYFSLPGK